MKRTYPLKLAGMFLGLTLLVGLVNECRGQSIDSLKKVILSIQTEQRLIQGNLFKAHKEHSVGTLFLAGGIVCSIGGALIYSRQRDDQDLDLNNRSAYLMLAGAAMLTAGAIIQIDSHKFIGRAGIIKFKKR